jgi:periplasmic divalent cation tolerance protein
LRDWLCTQHPYDVPEVIAVPVTDGAPDYLAWVANESR